MSDGIIHENLLLISESLNAMHRTTKQALKKANTYDR